MRFTYPSGSRPLEGYTIKRGIGVGGFGEVYFAVSDAGKEVALKRIQRNLDIELRGVRHCLNLKHVNLISLWDIRTSGEGESWVIMEYVPGQSLRDVIEAHPHGLPAPLIREWFVATAAGVAYLHDRGIVHRDLKPGNIFRDDDEQVIKIGDYGLAKFISCSNRDGQTESVGTFHYMAPEIGKGVYGKEIDVYALGIILYEMICGHVPFEGESSQEIIMKHLTALPEVDVLPVAFRGVVAKALQKDPQRRYQSVQELIASFPDRVEVATGSAAATGAAIAASPVQASVIPPVQPMFIGEQTQYDGATAPEDGIVFGEVHIAESDLSQAPSEATQFVAAAATLPEEPIARAVTGGWRQMVDWWQNANVSTPIKFILLAVAILVLLANSAWLIPTCLALGLVYLLYYAVRSWSRPAKRMPKQRKVKKSELQALIRQQLGQRPAGDRLGELVGSLLVAAIVALVTGLLAVAATGGDLELGQWAFYAWLVITSVAGSWALLVASKVWEHRKGEALLRRFIMVTVGVGVALVGFFAAQFLHVYFGNSSGQFSEFDLDVFGASTFLSSGEPKLIGYLVFFVGLFAVLRWWRQADPLRKTRLSIWTTGVCLIWGMVVGQLFHFPLPWSCMVALTMSVGTQIAAPWLSPEERLALAGGTPFRSRKLAKA